MSKVKVLGAAAAALVLVGVGASAEGDEGRKGQRAQHQMQGKQHATFTPDQLKWGPGPASLPPGAQVAVVEGDMTKPEPFTIRAKLPDGYVIPAHTHPGIEHVTVISGTFQLGMGSRYDEGKLQDLKAGSFAVMQPGMQHFAAADGETEIQLHGRGPWGINYVNPADDPRNKGVGGAGSEGQEQQQQPPPPEQQQEQEQPSTGDY